jgi:hypothetical protein
MSADAGLTHRFPMLRRAIEHQVKNGRYDESLTLIEELLTLAPEDASLSKLKARFAADLIKRAAQAQKREAGTRIVLLFEKLVPANHLGNQEKGLLAKAKEDLLSL